MSMFITRKQHNSNHHSW